MQRFACRLTKEDYGGWKAIRLSNGLIDVVVAPEIGGRIIQLRLASRDFLYVNRRHQGRVYTAEENCAAAGWKNYGGSKVWPAPQGWESAEQWPGPPDPILDGGSYSCRVLEETASSVAIGLESQHDEYTGLTFSREIKVREDRSTVQIRHTMRNTSSRRVRWAVWQVTQQAIGSALIVYAPARRDRQILGDQPFEGAGIDSETGFWKLAYRDQVAKFAVEAEQGWLAAVRPGEGRALVEEFQLFSGKPYPDGAPVEFWVNGSGTFTIPGGRVEMDRDPNGCDPFIETEILSPLVELNPGQDYAFSITWQATTLPSPGLACVNSLAVVSEALNIRAEGQKLNVRCGFGVFQHGSVELVIIDGDGNPENTIPLAEVTPLEPCCVDQRIPRPDRFGSIRLQLKDPAGRFAGIIEECRE
ncbi:MAG TPA: DUF4380 domain-containing protein [Terriglobia bacterium]|nr:DUF4380 domain-containing protein [Terriglobia bacterium]